MTSSLQIKNGIYQVVLSYQNAAGKRKQKWISTGLPEKGNKRRAQEMAVALQEKYKNDYECWDKDISFVDCFPKWLSEKKPAVQTSTYEKYKNCIDRHIIPYFRPLGLKINEVKARHIKDYYTYMVKHGNLKNSGPLKPRSIREHGLIIKEVLQDAVIRGDIPYNVAQGVDLPRQDKRFTGEFLTIEEANKLIQVARQSNDVLYPAIVLSLYYGLRRSEVLALKWSHIDFTANIVRIRSTAVRFKTLEYKDITKTDSSRRDYPLIGDIRILFEELKAQAKKHQKALGKEYSDSGFICQWPNGGPIDPSYLTSHFRRLQEKNGLRIVRYHDLRHTCASILYDKGWEMKDIQEWLGHADIETTGNIYTHIRKSRMTEMSDRLSQTFTL